MIEIIEIIIVDDHEIVRDGLRALLLGHPKIKVIGEAGEAKSLFVLLKKHQPQIVVLDIALPGMSGIEIAKVLQKDYPQIKTLMLSANTQIPYIEAAVKAGAQGFLPKNCSRQEWVDALLTIQRGDLFFGKDITHSVFKTLAQKVKIKKQPAKKALSERELQVLKAFAEGLSYKEVADQLCINPRTVESHKKNIFEKMDFHNNVDLIKYAIKEGLIYLD